MMTNPVWLKSFILIAVLLILPPKIWALKNLPPKTIASSSFCSDVSKIDQFQKLPLTEVQNGVDRILISKSRKKLYLLAQNYLVKEYNVAFGFGFLHGAKSQQGDGRTPEGVYKIAIKNPKSNYRKALRVSYPNHEDVSFAKNHNVSAGGDIMIHGFPVRPIDGLNPVEVRQKHPILNWTQGCIAVTDEEIDQIYSVVKVETTVEICSLETELISN